MSKHLNLVIDQKPLFTRDDFEVITERAGPKDPKVLKIKGPYSESFDKRAIELGEAKKNRNGRVYQREDVNPQIDLYRENAIASKTSYQALEHPPSTDVSLKDACAYVLEINEEYNSKTGSSLYHGVSRVTSDTPNGATLVGVINAGGGFGVSTRALGKVEESNDGNIVSDFQLIAWDVVAAPSCHSAYVQGILESKGQVLEFDENGNLLKNYEQFEKKLENLPRDADERKQHLFEAAMSFIRNL